MPRIDSYEAPAGVAIHPWISEADTKFNESGVFHTQVAYDASLPAIQTLMAKVTEAAEAKYAELTKDLSPAERKKWHVYVPYDMEDDSETGEPTGRVLFTFKRNHMVHVKGEEVELKVSLYDATGAAIPDEERPRIGTGSQIAVAFTMRDVKVPGTKSAGVKLDMFAVQIVSLSGGGGGYKFGRVTDPDETSTGGYVHKKPQPKAADEAEPEADAASEY